jgi:hypothetical protein
MTESGGRLDGEVSLDVRYFVGDRRDLETGEVQRAAGDEVPR